MSPKLRLRTCSILLVLLALPLRAPLAHDLTMTDTVVLLKSDGTYLIDLRVDVDALVLGASPESDDSELTRTLRSMSPAERQIRIDAAREMIERRVRLRFDGQAVRPWVDFPESGTPLLDGSPVPTFFGTTIRLSGRIPHGAETFSFKASRSFMAVHLTILEQGRQGGWVAPLEIGAESEPYRIGASVPPATTVGTGLRYLELGFMHILPRGLDHILFVLGLFLLGSKLASLLWQISAFTVAHTLTLALGIFGWVVLPGRLVESLIALSIVYVAVENLCTTELKPWRPLLVFGFGLLHGLGFAGVLRELGLPASDRILALLSFNFGVELGQLAVVLCAMSLVGWFRQRRWYRTVIVLPCSAVIALVGLYWTIERAGFGV